jgi:hypothetical protein
MKVKKPKTTSGFHCYLPNETVQMLKQDSIHFNKTTSEICAAIYRTHFAFKTAERAIVYKLIPKKTIGRKVVV